MAEIAITDLTTGTLAGTGVFDELMKATKAHIQEEYSKGRIKGSEYSQVYLGSVQSVMQTALQFLLQKQRADQEAELISQQILNEQKRGSQLDAEILNIPKQGVLLDAQAAKTTKEASLLDKQILQADEEILIAKEEVKVKQAQVDVALAEVGIAQARLTNIPKEGAKLDAETALLLAQELKVDKDVALTDKRILQADEELLIAKEEVKIKTAQLLNIPKEGLVIDAQKCKLQGEFDLIVEQKNRTTTEITKLNSEISLLNQKKLTEQAQVSALGVDTDSIIGRQKALYAAQTSGYARDSEQKAAKMMIDAMMTQYTTDGISPSGAGLDVAGIGSVVAKLKAGIGA